MCAFFASAWDWAKRLFGRSRTIFLNVIGVLGMIFVEMSDYLTGLNWDDFFKHEVSVTIALAVNILNVLVRIYTTTPVNFGKLPAVEEKPVNPVEEVQSPKAE